MTRWCTIGGHEVPTANAPVLQAEVCEELLARNPLRHHLAGAAGTWRPDRKEMEPPQQVRPGRGRRLPNRPAAWRRRTPPHRRVHLRNPEQLDEVLKEIR